MGTFSSLHHQTQEPLTELDLVLGVPLGSQSPLQHARNFTKQDRVLSEVTIQLWTNFARTGWVLILMLHMYHTKILISLLRRLYNYFITETHDYGKVIFHNEIN